LFDWLVVRCLISCCFVGSYHVATRDVRKLFPLLLDCGVTMGDLHRPWQYGNVGSHGDAGSPGEVGSPGTEMAWKCNVLAPTITMVVKRFINDYNDKQSTTEHRSDAQQMTERMKNTMAVYCRRLLNVTVSLEGIVEVYNDRRKLLRRISKS
jgi:hypothetical protein